MAPPTNPPRQLTRQQRILAAAKSREWIGPTSYAIFFQIIHIALALAQLMLALYTFYTMTAYAKWEESCYKYHSRTSAHTKIMRPPMTVYYLGEDATDPRSLGSFGEAIKLSTRICYAIIFPAFTLALSLCVVLRSMWRCIAPQLQDGILAASVQMLLLASTMVGELWLPVDHAERMGALPICLVGSSRRAQILNARLERQNTLFAWEMVLGAEMLMVFIYLALVFLGIYRKMKDQKTADIELVARHRVENLLANETTPRQDGQVALPVAAHVHESPRGPPSVGDQVNGADADLDMAVNTPLPYQHRDEEEEEVGEVDLGTQRRESRVTSWGSDGGWTEIDSPFAESEGSRRRV